MHITYSRRVSSHTSLLQQRRQLLRECKDTFDVEVHAPVPSLVRVVVEVGTPSCSGIVDLVGRTATRMHSLHRFVCRCGENEIQINK